MPYIGELFVSELLKKPVLDKMGEDIGVLTDFIREIHFLRYPHWLYLAGRRS